MEIKGLDLSQNSGRKNIHVMNRTNYSHPETMSFPFVSVSIRKNIEPFDSAVDIFNHNTSF